MKTVSLLTRVAAVLLGLAIFSSAARAQTFTSLHDFQPSDGTVPRGAFLLASDGLLYGTTSTGGIYGNGTVFRVNRDGSNYAVLFNFQDATTGTNPNAGVIEGTDGLLYGTTPLATTSNGVVGGNGTLFRLAKDGSGFVVLHAFTDQGSGANIYARLTQGTDGWLYGAALNGGTFGYGTVFRLGTDGSGFTVLHQFSLTDGTHIMSGLRQASDGRWYGVAQTGGQYGNGTVFCLNSDGSGFAVLHAFNQAASEGTIAEGILCQAADGLLYGTTFHGGLYNYGTVFRLATDGGGFTTLHHFHNNFADGGEPVTGGVIQGTDLQLYGVTQRGGVAGYGIIYRLATDGSGFTDLHDFFGSDGKYPGGGLTLDQNGDLYGMAPSGGGYLNGDAFCFGAPKPPRITSALFLASVYGNSFSYTVTATNNPTSFGATGLPAGLSIDSATGNISGTLDAAGNFSIALTATNSVGTGTATLSLNVSPAQATVTLSNLSQTYDGAPKPVTVTTSPAGLSCSVRYGFSDAAPSDAGTYNVVATISDPNYTGSASGTLTVAPAAATITLGNLAATYDGSPKAASAVTTPAGLGVTLTYAGSATAPTEAGSYAVNAAISDPNYTGSSSGTLIISASAQSITFPAIADHTYGDPAFALAAAATSGLPVSYAVIAGPATVSGNTLTLTGAGTVIVRAAQAGNADYSAADNVDVSFNVAKAAASITLGALSQTYDGTPKPVSANTTPAGLGVTLTYDGSVTAPTSAGSYAITASINDANYTGSASGTLVIAKATASVTLSNLNQTYSGAPRAAAVSTTPAGLATVVTYNGNATAPTSAGSYAVVATVNDANYAGTTSGTLTIAPAIAGVTLGNLNQTYDGTSKIATVATSPAGLAVQVTYDGSAIAPTNAGSYAIVATITDPNYTGGASGTLVVNAAPATITLNGLAQTYTGAPRGVSATTAPAGLAVTITYDGSGTAPTNAGTYAIAAAIDDPNYTGSVSGTLTVAKAVATVVLGNLAQAYTGAGLSATVATTPASLNVSVTYNGSATLPIGPGSYAVAATVNDANYSGSASGTLVISVVLQASNGSPSGSGPAITTINDPAAPGGTWVKFAATGKNQWIQFKTGTIPAGTYRLNVAYLGEPLRAKCSVKVDGNGVGGTVDEYASSPAYSTVAVGTVTFSSTGTHVIQLTTTGRNAASTGWNLSAAQFVLTR